MNPHRVRYEFREPLRLLWLASKRANCNRDVRRLIVMRAIKDFRFPEVPFQLITRSKWYNTLKTDLRKHVSPVSAYDWTGNEELYIRVRKKQNCCITGRACYRWG